MPVIVIDDIVTSGATMRECIDVLRAQGKSHISESVRNDIFRRFVKGKSGPGTESGGTGLGL